MNTTIAPSFASIELGAPQVYRNIVVFPIIHPSHDSAGWLTLGEALEQQLLTVTEVSHGGSVPELSVINRADRPVLLLDGEELIGAKQNRVLNTTILLKERSETVVPVSCTEHGRWSYVSAAFADSKVVMAHKARAHKSRSVSESLASSSSYQSDQGEVWEEIAALHSSIGSSSPTGAMHDAYKARERELDQCVDAFRAVPGQTGLLVVIGGQVAGFDFIPRPEIYARQHAKLVKSYLIDTVAQSDPRAANPDAAGVQAAGFLRAAAECPAREFPSIGYGTDCRYRSAHQPSTTAPRPPALCGSALVHEGQIIHAAFFNIAVETKPAPDTMRPLAWRRSRHVE